MCLLRMPLWFLSFQSTLEPIDTQVEAFDNVETPEVKSDVVAPVEEMEICDIDVFL